MASNTQSEPIDHVDRDELEFDSYDKFLLDKSEGFIDPSIKLTLIDGVKTWAPEMGVTEKEKEDL